MRQFNLTIGLAVCAVAALVQARSLSAGDQVPFRGSLDGTVTITPVVGDPNIDVHVEIDAAGHASHLGEIRVSIPHDVDRRPPPNPSLASGEYVFTAANGDELYAEFSGEATLLAPGFLYVVETATFTGGTGRFSGATGGFVCERLFDTAGGTTVGDFEGTISSVGSK